MTFAIYDDPGGASGGELWSQTSSVPTDSGVFNVVLGPIAGVDFNQALWLGITVGNFGADPELEPRTPLTSVPSSFALVLPYKAVADTSAPVFWSRIQGRVLVSTRSM